MVHAHAVTGFGMPFASRKALTTKLVDNAFATIKGWFYDNAIVKTTFEKIKLGFIGSKRLAPL